MTIRKVFLAILGLVALLVLVQPANAQMTEQAARAQARDIARGELHARVHFKADQFLSVHRDEELEEALAIIVGGQAGLTYIYEVSPEGAEFRENAVVYHVWADVDWVLTVVVNPRDGNTYRIHGFGLSESLDEFQELMVALKLHVTSPDQAESLADFYRKVNPENYRDLAPISSLLELKQAAERQCHNGTESFDADEKAFAAWWDHAKLLYAALPFQVTAAPQGSGYVVRWIVLSSASRGNCGGAPLRAGLEVNSDGRVGKLTFSPLREPIP